LIEMSPFPTRERKPVPPASPRETRDAAEAREPAETADAPSDFQPESGALAPCEPVDEAQLDHDRRDDL
jgi:hypothetical protein